MEHLYHLVPNLFQSQVSSLEITKLCLLNLVHLNNLEVGVFLKTGDSWNINSKEIVAFYTSPEKALKPPFRCSCLTESPHQSETATDRWSSLHLKKFELLRSMDRAGESGNVWSIWEGLVGLVLIWICKIKNNLNIPKHPSTIQDIKTILFFFQIKCAKRKEILPRPSVVWWYNQRRSYPHAPLQPLVSWIYGFLFPKTPPTNVCSKLVDRNARNPLMRTHQPSPKMPGQRRVRSGPPGRQRKVEARLEERHPPPPEATPKGSRRISAQLVSEFFWYKSVKWLNRNMKCWRYHSEEVVRVVSGNNHWCIPFYTI